MSQQNVLIIMSEEDRLRGRGIERSKRVRAAHRGSVTRIVGQLENALASRDACKLKQLKQSLIDKSSTLARLDDELIEGVDGDQLEAEVEQADLVKEKICLAVISIEEALEVLVDPNLRITHQPQEEATPSALTEYEEEEEEHFAMPRDDHIARETPTADHPAPHTDLFTLEEPPFAGAAAIPSASPLPLLPRLSPLIGTPPSSGTLPLTTISALPSAVSTSSSGLSLLGTSPWSHPLRLSGAPSPLLSVPLTAPHVSSGGVPLQSDAATGALSLPRGASPGYSPLTGGAMSHSPVAQTIMPKVKLPKLSIKRFTGDLTKWVTFWDSFNSSIHTNPTLSSVDKFNYLMSFVESSAAEAIAGLSITAANYDEAIATLKKRFGNPQLIVNRHMEALLGVSAVTSHHDTKGLRRLLDTVEAHIRGLRALGVPRETYGGLLTSVLVSRLPPEID